MKLVKLTSLSAKPIVAQTIKSKNNDNLYYNIKHGSSGSDLWVYSCGLNKTHFSPTSPDSSLELTGDNYILKPVKKNNEVLKDRQDNVLYNITIDRMENHKKDLIVFWEIPNKKYKDVKFETNGDVVVIGKGYVGKERDGFTYKSPAPVLEIQGDCVLSWSATDIKGNIIKQSIKYDYLESSWDIKPLVIEKITAKE